MDQDADRAPIREHADALGEARSARRRARGAAVQIADIDQAPGYPLVRCAS